MVERFWFMVTEPDSRNLQKLNKVSSLITPNHKLQTINHKPLLSLRQAISSFIAPFIQQFQGANFEITTQAHIKPDNILLVER